MIWCTLINNYKWFFKYVGRIAEWICGGNVLQNIQLRDHSHRCVCVDSAVREWWQHWGIWSSENGHDHILCILRTSVFSCVSLFNIIFTSRVSSKVNITCNVKKIHSWIICRHKAGKLSKLVTISSLKVQINDNWICWLR